MQARKSVLDLAIRSYFFELERRDRIHGNLGLQITALGFLVGLAGFLYTSLPVIDSGKPEDVWVYRLAVGLLIVAQLMNCAALVNLIQSGYQSPSGRNAPSPDYEYVDVEENVRVVGYVEDGLPQATEADVEVAVARALTGLYAEAANANYRANEARVRDRERSILCLMLGTGFTLAAVVPVVVLYERYPALVRLQVI
jgi:hypothetical protein